MTLSVDDEITLVEAAVILIGIGITWAVYRWEYNPDGDTGAASQGAEPPGGRHG